MVKDTWPDLNLSSFVVSDGIGSVRIGWNETLKPAICPEEIQPNRRMHYIGFATLYHKDSTEFKPFSAISGGQSIGNPSNSLKIKRQIATGLSCLKQNFSENVYNILK